MEEFINIDSNYIDSQETLGISNYGKVNSRIIGSSLPKVPTFLIGPHFNYE